MSINSSSSPTLALVIRSVNADNVVPEFDLISSFIPKFRFVSVDTEFAGVNSDYGGAFLHQITRSELYKLLKMTVNDLKLVQVGLTLADADGNLPRDPKTGNPIVWEFNFKDFDPARDLHYPVWIETLKMKGMDFEKNRDYGIESVKFAELMMASGLVCNSEEGVTWVAFHSAYDFGYLLKMLTGKPLPDDLPQFLAVLKTFFGDNVCDVKHLMKHCSQGLHGGLGQVAKTLKVEPAAGKEHLAGANSLLTWNIFQKIKDLCGGEPERFGGVICGLEPWFL